MRRIGPYSPVPQWASLASPAWLVGRFPRITHRIWDTQLARFDAAAFGCHRRELRPERLVRGARWPGAARQRRGDGGDHARRDGEPEGDAYAVVERAGDQAREELPAD